MLIEQRLLIIVFVIVLFAINFIPLIKSTRVNSIEKFTLTSGNVKFTKSGKNLILTTTPHTWGNTSNLTVATTNSNNIFTCVYNPSDQTYWLKYNGNYVVYAGNGVWQLQAGTGYREEYPPVPPPTTFRYYPVKVVVNDNTTVRLKYNRVMIRNNVTTNADFYLNIFTNTVACYWDTLSTSNPNYYNITWTNV